jgi:hypothetical protein
VSAREEIQALLAKHAIPGTSRVDVWEVGQTRRFVGLIEMQRNNVAVVERLLIQGGASIARMDEELLAALKMRVEGAA